MKMRISALVLLTLLSVSCAWAQSPNSAPNLQNVNYVDVLKKQLLRESGIYQPQVNTPAPAPTPMAPTPAPSGKTSALTVVQVGKASNPFTILQARQNQVFASDEFKMVGWIHRQDQELWGGTPVDQANGVLRFDYSIDASTSTPHGTLGTWTIDKGPLNALPYTNAARGRYPQATYFIPSNAGTSFDSVRFAFLAPTTDGAGWGNYNYGYAKRLNNFCKVASCNFGTTNNQVFSNYNFISSQQDQLVLIPGGLSTGKKLPGNQSEFWTVDIGFRNNGANDGVTLDYFTIWKAASNAADQTNWTRHATIRPPYAKYTSSGSRNFYSATGNPLVGQFNLAVSPDKKWIWVALNTDLAEPGFPNNQTPDINPVFYYSDDSGATFKGPIEVKLREYPVIIDSTTTCFNAQGQVVPCGSASAVDQTAGIPQASNFDLTVDANGNPHLFIRLVSAAEENLPLDSLYYYSPGARACLWDITTSDKGLSWCPVHIATLNALQATKQGYDLDEDNFPQVSINEAGTVVFYSWVDDVRLGLDANGRNDMAPNLYGRSRKINGNITDIREFSSTDPTYRGQIWFPTVSPTVRSYQNAGTTTYQVPTVFLSQFGPTQLSSTSFGYISNIVYTDDAATYKTPARDIAIDQVLKPSALLCGAASEDVSFTVRNVGTTPISQYTAVYSINGGPEVSQVVTLNPALAPNATATMTFTSPAAMPNNGTYVVKMKALLSGDFNCANNIAERVSVNVGGTNSSVFPNANPPAYCGSAVLDAGVQGATYLWELIVGGVPTTIGNTQQIVRGATPGEQIRVTISGLAPCPALVDTINIQVNDLPNVSLPADTAACVANLPLALVADPTNAPNRSFEWTKAGSATVIGTSNTLNITPALGSGEYSVKVTNNSNQCVANATVNVRVWDITVNLDAAIKATYGANTNAVGGTYNVCGARSIDVTNASNLGSSFEWYKDGVFQGNSPYPVFDSSGTHTYRVVIKDPLNCKTLDQSVTVASFDSVFAVISSNLSSFTNGVPRTNCDTACFTNSSTNRATAITGKYWVSLGSNATLVRGSLGSATVNGSDEVCFVFSGNSTSSRVIRLFVTSGACTANADLTYGSTRFTGTCGTTAIGEADFGFDVYPNPTNGMLNINLQLTKGGNASFKLMDVTGREVYNLSREVNATEMQSIDMANLPSGIYLLQVSTDQGTAISRIVKN